VYEQALEHGLDVAGLAENLLQPRSSPSRADDREVAGAGVAEALAVENQRDTRNEERLADDELAALRNLDDDRFAQLHLQLHLKEATDREARAGGAQEEPRREQDQRIQ
jgi:hypothetical protein